MVNGSTVDSLRPDIVESVVTIVADEGVGAVILLKISADAIFTNWIDKVFLKIQSRYLDQRISTQLFILLLTKRANTRRI